MTPIAAGRPRPYTLAVAALMVMPFSRTLALMEAVVLTSNDALAVVSRALLSAIE